MNANITKTSAVLLAILLAFSVAGCSASGQETDTKAATPAGSIVQTQPEKTYVGLLQAQNETQIIPSATGKILQSPCAVGDPVSKGDLLYLIDDNGLADSIATTQNSVAKANITLQLANENVADLNIYAPCDGILEDFTVQQGERVSASQIGTVVDEKTIVATVPFNTQQVSQIQVGDTATLISSLHMTSLTGTVTMIYDATVAREDGSILRNIEIEAENPGGFVSGSTVGAEIQTAGGVIASALSGTAICGKSSPLVSHGSGYAKTVYAKSGKQVQAGELILVLENDTLVATARRAALDRDNLLIKLNTLQADYADCSIYAPISGVVIEKTKDAPDSITSQSDSIMTIADISQLSLSLAVEEADLSFFSPGAVISMATDDTAYPQITGVVANVNTQGQSNNGILLYPVTITVSNPGQLMPGTQVTISIS